MTSNIFLENKAKQIKFKNFRGVIFRDEFKNITHLYEECGIYGSLPRKYDNHHWCCWYKKGNNLYCFDSYGLKPTKEIQKYLGKNILYSTFQIQKFNEQTCGEFCLYVLDNLNKGNNYVDVVLRLIDKKLFKFNTKWMRRKKN